MRHVDGDAFRVAVPIGPLLVILGYLVVSSTDAVVGDLGLVAEVAWPTLAALLVALVRPGRRRRWLSVALGLFVGTVVVVGAVVGGITLLAAVLSDPGPSR